MGKTTTTRPLSVRIGRTILKSLLFLFLFIVLVFVFFLTPPGQRFLTVRAEKYLEKKLQTKVDIKRVSFDPFGNVKLSGVYVEDRNKDTLLSGATIRARLNIFKLFSNKIRVKDLKLQDVNAIINRSEKDSVFNYQFIVDAFSSEKDPLDTSKASAIPADLDKITFENVRVNYNDAVTGSAMNIYAGSLITSFHSTNLNDQVYNIPTITGNNIKAKIRQVKPLAKSEPLSKDIAEAAQKIPMQLMVGDVDLEAVDLSYANDVSAVYADAHIGNLESHQRLVDLQEKRLDLEELIFTNSSVSVRMDKKQQADIIIKQVEQEIEAQRRAGWGISIDKINLENDTIQFDNNNIAASGYGIDYNHIYATDLKFQATDLVMNDDSTGATISAASVKDKSGFILNDLRGNILYANNQAYANDLFIKTPGTEIKRNLSMRYASRDELVHHFDRTVMGAEIENSYVQVKDILMFAPALRRQKAFSRPNDVWQLDLYGTGTLDRLVIGHVNFNGLYNTQLAASGTLTGLSHAQQAGGNFRIARLHTTQSDIALFTGKRLSTATINIPEDISLNGTINGNAGTIQTNLNINTSSGGMAVNGRFSNLGDPLNIVYDATIRTASLNLGKILKQQGTIGTVSGNFKVTGTGTDPANADLKFTAAISSLDYNQYRYSNLIADGTISNGAYDIHADIKDPNATANLFVKGDFNGNSFTVNGMVDSLKTQALHLTPGFLIARGKIEGTVSNLNSDNATADILISKGLFVSGKYRLPLDTISIKSGRNTSGNYLTVESDIANIQLNGEYRIGELGNIIQNSIQPYLPALQKGARASYAVHPYNFTFNASIDYSPIFSSIVPGLTSFDNITTQGTAASGAGINAIFDAPSLVYNGTAFSQLHIVTSPSDSGLQIVATAQKVQQGASLQLYNVKINALASGNDVHFTAATDDLQGRNKYRFAGLFTVKSPGNYSVSLDPSNLILNYETWAVAGGNRINISPSAITAENFVLSKGSQQLRISNANLTAGSLNVEFTQFRLATITGFMKSDSLTADGLINGNLTITNILKTPAFTGHLLINDFSMQKDTIGNVDIQVTAAGSKHNTIATITGRGNDITMTGYFIPVQGEIITEFDVNVRQLQLSTVEGALSKVLSSASGSMNGTVKIRGTLSDPKVTGDIGFNNASFIPTILGSRFKIGDQKLSLSENGIAFDNFIIQDSTGNKLILNGRAITKDFTHYELDLAINAENFELLNTVKAPGRKYYGKLNITANIRIRGTELKPNADGTITVNQGTELTIVIPQVDEGVAQRDGIVEFIDMDAPENDSLFMSYDSLNQSGILGFDVATTIEIKKEALFNIIVDEANGDFLSLQGEAQLSAGIDPSGKITLGGNYVLEQGSYQLSFNFLRRKFDIQKGSNIIWTGQPTDARLDIQAVYVSNTPPLDLVASQLTSDVNRNIYLQKLPFEVILDVQGELLKPIIDFDIQLPENNYGVSNDIVTAVQTKLDLIRQDEGEINKQVFSLLLMNRFVGENPFQAGSSAFSFNSYARQSVSKLLTEQLNQLAAGLIDGVDINFDLVSTDDYTTGSRMGRTDLNIGLSKRLLSNRLKITVGSNFQIEGPQSGNQQANNIAGNVAVDYQVSRDGRYMLRFYRQNEYQGIVDGYIIETGMSFIFSVDYDRFMQIFRKKKRPAAKPAQNATGVL